MAATAEALRRLDELRQQKVLLGADELVRRLPATEPTGLSTLDELLGGGLPEGKVLVLDGVAGAPVGALSLQVLATFTRSERLVAVVDRGEGFDPASAAEAGVVLERLLVCRPTRAAEAVKAAHVLLASGAFAVVVLDLREGGRGKAAAGAAATAAAAAAATATAQQVVSSTARSATSAAPAGAPHLRVAGPPRTSFAVPVAVAVAAQVAAPAAVAVAASVAVSVAAPVAVAVAAPAAVAVAAPAAAPVAASAPAASSSPFRDTSPLLVRFTPGDPSSPLTPRRRRPGREEAIGAGAWLRLARDAEATRSRLIILGGDGGAGSFAAATLTLGRPRARWVGHGPGRTLEGVQVVASLAHNRLGLPPGRATLLFDAPASFPEPPHGSAAGSTAGTPGGTAAGRKVTPSPIGRGLRTGGTRRAASMPRALTAPHARPEEDHAE